MTRGQLVSDDFVSLPAFTAYASLLSDGTASDWLSLATQPLPAATSNARDTRARSRSNYGRPLADIEADLLGIADPAPKASDALGRRKTGGTA